MEKITKSDSEWREQLTPAQYAVLRQHAIARPFTGLSSSSLPNRCVYARLRARDSG